MYGRKYILIISIILLGLFLRIWRYHDLFYFAIDEEKGSYIINQIATASHFPTVGHPSSIGFRLGPGLYYALAPFFLLFGPAPITWGYVSIAISIISLILIYHIGSLIHTRVGIYALMISSFSYLNIIYERRGWQVSFHSLIALLVLFALIMIKRGKTGYWYLMTATLIAATHVEVATILFLPLVLIISLVYKLHISKRTMIICTMCFLFSHASLLVFDIRHEFLNARYLINYFRPDASIRIAKNTPLKEERSIYLAHNLIPNTLIRTLYNPSEPNLAIQYANCPQYLQKKYTDIGNKEKIVFSIVMICFVWWVFKHKRKNNEAQYIGNMILTYMIIIFSGICLYTYGFHGEMAEYYLFSLFSYFFLAVSVVIEMMSTRYTRWAIAGILFFFIWHNSDQMIRSIHPYGYTHKINAVSYVINTVGDKTFSLDSFQTCWYSGGYRYLFSLYGKEPTTSYMDQYMSEYYTPDMSTQPAYHVTILTPEIIDPQPDGYEVFRKQTISEAEHKKTFGAIEVYIKKISTRTSS